jgi:hypothetical protein
MAVQPVNLEPDGYPTRQVWVRMEFLIRECNLHLTRSFAGVDVSFYINPRMSRTDPKFLGCGCEFLFQPVDDHT